MGDPREGRRGWGSSADWMEVDKRGTRKRRAWKFRGISGKKGMISVGVPRELWTPSLQSHRYVRPNELPANPLEGKPDRSPAQEGHWLMFFYVSLRSALWISRASLYFDPLYTFVFPRARPRRRPFDATANVFWDLIEGAEWRITKKYDFAIYAFHPWNSIFRRSIDQRVITLSALATTTSHAILFAFAFLYLSHFVANAFWDLSYNNKSISPLSFQDWRLFFDEGGHHKFDKYFTTAKCDIEIVYLCKSGYRVCCLFINSPNKSFSPSSPVAAVWKYNKFAMPVARWTTKTRGKHTKWLKLVINKSVENYSYGKLSAVVASAS